MNTQTIGIDLIKERAVNPNVMAPERYKLLVEAIRAMGFLQPILVRAMGDGTYQVVDGHHRLRAARELGMTDVPCVVVEPGMYGDEEVNALAIGMNRLRGDLDLALVAESMAALAQAGWSTDDLSVTGFTAGEVNDLLRSVAALGEDVMVQPAAEPDPEEPVDPATQWLLEIVFNDQKKYKAARKALRKAAGEGGELADGLMNIISQ